MKIQAKLGLVSMLEVEMPELPFKFPMLGEVVNVDYLINKAQSMAGPILQAAVASTFQKLTMIGIKVKVIDSKVKLERVD